MRSLSRNQLRAHLTQLRLPCQDSIPGAQLYSASQVCRSGHQGGSACWGECMPRYNACRRQRSTSRHACSPRRQRMLVAGPQQMSVPPPWPEARASERLDPELQHWPALYLCCPHRDFDVHGIDINSNIKRQKTQPEGPQPRFGEASLDCSGGLRFREGR